MSLFYISKLANKAKRLKNGESVQKIPTVYRIENFDDENDITDDETLDRRGRKRKRPSVPPVSVLATEEDTDVVFPTLLPPVADTPTNHPPVAKTPTIDGRRLTRSQVAAIAKSQEEVVSV
jgi:hypothetical protein